MISLKTATTTTTTRTYNIIIIIGRYIRYMCVGIVNRFEYFDLLYARDYIIHNIMSIYKLL